MFKFNLKPNNFRTIAKIIKPVITVTSPTIAVIATPTAVIKASIAVTAAPVVFSPIAGTTVSEKIPKIM